jgi:hypothetical protein
MQLAYSSTIDAQSMLHFDFDSMSELNHHIGLAAGPDGTCKQTKYIIETLSTSLGLCPIVYDAQTT